MSPFSNPPGPQVNPAINPPARPGVNPEVPLGVNPGVNPGAGPPPDDAATGASPLTPEHLRQLAQAKDRAGKLRRTVYVALFDGWTIAALAVPAVIYAIFAVDWLTLVMGLAMSAVAFVELRSAARVRRLDPAATQWLGWNQVALACLLSAYALWQIRATLTGPGTYAQDPEIAQMLGPEVVQLERTLSLAVYGGLIAVAVFVQGGTALYYFSRTRHLRAYVRETPPWIVRMERSGVHLS